MEPNTPSRADRRLRIAEIVIGLVIAVLLAALLFSGGLASQEQLQKTVEEEVAGAVKHMNYQAGDTYQIEISPDSPTELLAASRGLLSAVRVEASFRVQSGSQWRPQTQTQTLSGAGVIYRLDKDLGHAYVITNYHVVYSADALSQNGISEDIRLFLYGMELPEQAIEASFVGGSAGYDIAVLEVNNSALLRESSAIAATFANSDEVSVLETAIAIGNPEGGGIAATVGHVNVDSEQIGMSSITGNGSIVSMRVMRIDTAVNSGNSGGGLFNTRGEVIGIVNAKVADSSVENIGYAIPSNVAKNIADNILYYCADTEKTSAYRCLLGITVTTASSATVYDTDTGRVHIVEEVSIASIRDGAPVEGVLREGDVLTSIRIGSFEQAVTRTFHIVDPMLTARVGDTVTLTFLRDGTQQQATFTITEASLTAA